MTPLNFISDLWHNCKVAQINQASFKRGEAMRVLPMHTKDWIVTRMEESHLYGTRSIGSLSVFFSASYNQFQNSSKVLCLPALKEALQGDLKAQSYYSLHRVISYSSAEPWQKSLINSKASSELSIKELNKKLPRGMFVKSQAKQRFSGEKLAEQMTLDFYGNIITAREVMSHFNSKFLELRGTFVDKKIEECIGKVLHPSEMTRMGNKSREFISDAMETLFLTTIVNDCLDLYGISIPDPKDQACLEIFNMSLPFLPWDMDNENSPVRRIAKFLETAQSRYPNKDPWDHDIPLNKIISNNYERFFVDKPKGIETKKDFHQKTPAVAPEVSDEDLQPADQIFVNGFYSALKSSKGVSPKEARDLSKAFAKLIKSYKHATDIGYVEILDILEEGRGDSKTPRQVFEALEKRCRELSRSREGTSSLSNDFQIPLDSVDNNSKILPIQRIFDRHTDVDKDLENLPKSDITFANTKLLQLETDQLGVPKTVSTVGMTPKVSLVEYKIRRGTNASLRIYTRRIGESKILILGIKPKQSSINAENEIINEMAARFLEWENTEHEKSIAGKKSGI